MVVRTTLAALTLALVASCAAHGHARRSPYLPPAPDGSATVGFDVHMDGPFTLRRLIVVLDGAVLYSASLEHDRRPPALIWTGRPEPGDHTLQVLAETDVPCGFGPDPHEVLDVRAAHSFTVGRPPIAVVIRLLTRDVLTDFAERVHIEFEDRLA